MFLIFITTTIKQATNLHLQPSIQRDWLFFSAHIFDQADLIYENQQNTSYAHLIDVCAGVLIDHYYPNKCLYNNADIKDTLAIMARLLNEAIPFSLKYFTNPKQQHLQNIINHHLDK